MNARWEPGSTSVSLYVNCPTPICVVEVKRIGPWVIRILHKEDPRLFFHQVRFYGTNIPNGVWDGWCKDDPHAPIGPLR